MQYKINERGDEFHRRGRCWLERGAKVRKYSSKLWRISLLAHKSCTLCLKNKEQKPDLEKNSELRYMRIAARLILSGAPVYLTMYISVWEM